MAASMENVCNSLFQAYSSTDESPKAVRDFIDSLTSNQLLVSKDTGSIQEMLGHVHSCLTMTKQRMTGLHLLKVILSQCSTDVFQQNAERWIRLLLQIIQGHCEVSVYRLCLHLLCEIFEYSKTFSDVSRVIVGNVIQELMPILMAQSPSKVSTNDNIACINKCLQIYSGPLGPYKGKITSLVFKQLSKNSKSEMVHRCFALLCQCGPSGSKGIKHTETWLKQSDELLGSLELTLDSLYEGFEPDSGTDKEKKTCLPLPVIVQEKGDRSQLAALKSRWLTLCSCLEAMLREEMDAIAKIPVDRIIQLACRGLAVNCQMVLSKPTSERMLLASYITNIHQAVLGVLEQFIVTCRRFLLPYCSVITGLLSQELLWTKTKNTGYIMTFSSLRGHVYKVMTTWLKVLDGSAGVAQEAKTWIEEILHDCLPHTESFLLTSKMNHSSKEDEVGKMKKKKKGYQEISQGISSQRKVHVDANSRLVQAGLEVLYWLVTTSGSELDRKALQAIQAFTIKTLLSIQQSGLKQTPVPYAQWKCRRSLYRVLQACVLNTHSQAPPPVQCAVRIFSHGQTDRNLEVSSLCVEALRICEVVIHPRAPVLNSPIVCEHIIRIGSDPKHTDSDGIKNGNAVNNGVKGTGDHPTGNTTSSSIISKEALSGNSLKRPFSSVDSSERTDSVKKQSTGSVHMNREAVASGAADNSTIGDCQRDDNSSKSDEIDEHDSSSDDDDSDVDDVNEEAGSSEAYTSLKHTPVGKEPEIMADLQEDDSIVDAGNAKDVAGFYTNSTDKEMNDTDKGDINEEQDEEVSAMMLTFVDAEPDNN